MHKKLNIFLVILIILATFMSLVIVTTSSSAQNWIDSLFENTGNESTAKLAQPSSELKVMGPTSSGSNSSQ